MLYPEEKRAIRRRRIRRWVTWPIIIAVPVLLFLNCSGLLRLPILRPQASLQDRFTNDLRLTLPGSAKVTRGQWRSGMDPSCFYLLELQPSEVDPLIQSIRDNTKKVGQEIVERDATVPWHMGDSPPSWWVPQSHTDIQQFDITLTRPSLSTQGYFIYYSPAAGKVYVFWFDT